MVRVGWITDIHLNFLGDGEIDSFCKSILAAEPDILLVGGDIGEAHNVESYLQTLENRLHIPIYFVLGNHDFYRGSITKVRNSALQLTQQSRWLRWLPATGIVKLTKETCLIGHDTWADGRIGDYANSTVVLNDFFLIHELKIADSNVRLSKLNALGDEAAAFFRRLLPEALSRFDNILLLVHVPPFKESCWHEGKISDDSWLPHFTCKAVGDLLTEIMAKHSDKRMTVLCGHTHGSGEAQILPNLYVKTGGATYGWPQLQEIILIN
jgi:3',5'-cyclic AMP phosphodiesterase CpdA